MAQQRITFEWVIEENPVEGGSLFGDLDENAGRRFSIREQVIVTNLLRAFGLLFVVFFAATATGLTPEEQNVREATQGINFALRLEEQAWHTRDRGLLESLNDPRISEGWVDEWVDVWRDGQNGARAFDTQVAHVRQTHGLMHTSLLVEQPLTEWWHTSPVREERFYRKVDGEWLRTVPPRAYWGEPRTLDTEHIHFTYYERDAAAVEGAAQLLNDAYTAMYRTLGLEPAADTRYTIAIVPETVGRWNLALDTLEVTSPKLSRIPVNQSEAEFLADDVMGWFTYRVFREAAPNSSGRYLYRWPLLVWGLRGWLRYDLLPDSSAWRPEVMAVLQSSDELPLDLENVSSLNNEGRPTREDVIVRYLAAESFVAYVVDTYGRERLPDLLHTLVRRSNWQEIIAELYGHSPEEFEAGWNEYILEHYTPEQQAQAP